MIALRRLRAGPTPLVLAARCAGTSPAPPPADDGGGGGDGGGGEDEHAPAGALRRLMGLVSSRSVTVSPEARARLRQEQLDRRRREAEPGRRRVPLPELRALLADPAARGAAAARAAELSADPAALEALARHCRVPRVRALPDGRLVGD